MLLLKLYSWETFYARTLSHLSTKHTTTKPTPNSKPTTSSDSDPESEEDEEDDIDDDSDPGTSWFSEHNAPDKVLQFLTDEEFPLAPVNTNISKDNGDEQAPSILDLGTGNGSMLALLRKRGGYKGVMVGIDYSIRSVQLARELQRLRIHSAYLSDSEDEGSDGDDEGGKEGNGEGGDTNIRFEEWDILHGDVYETTTTTTTTTSEEGSNGKGKVDWFPYDKGGFDIVLDKGTFDAVSLSDEVIPDADGAAEGHASGKTVQRRVCERYPGIVRGLVRKGGFVVVTSCNWTEEELVAWFTRADTSSGGGGGEEEDKFVVWGRVEYPRFRFGGREGQGVCTVCFQRV
ncbi:hypothetical protein BO83DRAFT_375986 [Aspergillus eucalypticola CBS 122712]|uniref:Protein-lysine N-methyltransferase EFM4 n=1 Tax=Aspergillus eucalypticola (strain CBS 122712 / IBT 29274) TaxID=1448314 RepID=A0A317W4U1_ASPEC|nr:uncharacterized protein BO83DRAFT_375986 [Aspergillus eucalypticola CBS 122712]PWY80038.1 hypothetical protein BO83DRAFT_375986 [Aspergillus eucalypticola CBS 122712]